MSGRVLVTLAAITALTAPSAGCGDGGADSGGKPLIKAQYVREATSLCRRHRRQIADGLSKLESGTRSSGKELGKAFESVILPGFRAEFEELRELPIPSGDEHFFRLMQSKFAASLRRGEQSLASFFRIKPSNYSEFAEGTLMTREYGIKGCGSLARSPRAALVGF